MPERPAHARVRAWAYVVLLGGLLAAALVFAFAPDEPASATQAIRDNPAYEYDIGKIGGKSMVYAARFTEWLASLAHGQALAATIAVVSVAAALAMLAVARRMQRMPPAPARPRDAAGGPR
jgi:hypothetical protein